MILVANTFVSLNGVLSKPLGQKSHQMFLIDVSPETGCWLHFLIYWGIKKRSAEGNNTRRLFFILQGIKTVVKIILR